jgi:hypothetical protein
LPRGFSPLINAAPPLTPGVSITLAQAPDETNFFFIVPLAKRKDDESWALVCALLQRTLKSVLQQTDADFQVLVCGHDRPIIEEMHDSRIEFLSVDFPPPATAEAGPKDKALKRRRMLRQIARRGGGYFMLLDADDLVRDDLVETARAIDDPYGYILEAGYMLDAQSGDLAHVPGVVPEPFWHHCGSCAIFYVSPEDIGDGFIYHFRLHAEFKRMSAEIGRPLHELHEPMAIYVLNTGQNHSDSWRKNAVQRRLLDNIKAQAAPLPSDELRRYGIIPEEG